MQGYPDFRIPHIKRCKVDPCSPTSDEGAALVTRTSCSVAGDGRHLAKIALVWNLETEAPVALGCPSRLVLNRRFLCGLAESSKWQSIPGPVERGVDRQGN